jgi:hypothetical protein
MEKYIQGDKENSNSYTDINRIIFGEILEYL